MRRFLDDETLLRMDVYYYLQHSKETQIFKWQ